MRVRVFASALLCLCGAVAWQSLTAQEKPEAKETAKKNANALLLVPTAKAFVALLNEEQKAKAMLPFDSEKRVDWHFIPMESRKGLPIMEMEDAQKEAAFKLLRSAVSKVGYEKATSIMQLESVLLKLEGPKSEGRRNPEKYYFTIFGEPGPKKHWGLSVEGHHLSLNFTMQGGKILDSTPQFFATNPAELKDSYGEKFPKGLRVLKAEEQTGFALVKSLSTDQLAKASLPGETPAEIRGANEPQPPTAAAQGIAVSEFSDEQKETLRKLMTAYTSKMKPLVSKQRWALIEEAGFENIKFGWSGPQRPGIGHYYVVQGPTFVIEFINVQPDAAGNPANHVHCVWRDMQGDFDLEIAAK